MVIAVDDGELRANDILGSDSICTDLGGDFDYFNSDKAYWCLSLLRNYCRVFFLNSLQSNY